MRYSTLGASQVRLSLIGLGGHEFLPDGRVKAMGDDFHEAVQAGACERKEEASRYHPRSLPRGSDK